MSTQPNTNDSSTSNTNTRLSRRDFLKYSAGAVGATGISGLLAACAAGGFGGGTVTINFWDMAWGNSSYFDVGNQLVKEFNNTHKGINVVYRGTPWANWYQTFTTAIGSGTQPDISTGASFMGAQFYGAHDVLALDDVVNEVKQNGQYNDYLPNVFAPMLYQGRTITWPWAIDIRIPFYRTDLFQIVAGLGTVISIICAGAAGYTLSRYHKLRPVSNYSRALMLVQMFPLILALIPLFIIFKDAGPVNTYYSAILVYTVLNLPFATWMFEGFFDAIPRELEEAASFAALRMTARTPLQSARGKLISKCLEKEMEHEQ